MEDAQYSSRLGRLLDIRKCHTSPKQKPDCFLDTAMPLWAATDEQWYIVGKLAETHGWGDVDRFVEYDEPDLVYDNVEDVGVEDHSSDTLVRGEYQFDTDGVVGLLLDPLDDDLDAEYDLEQIAKQGLVIQAIDRLNDPRILF